MGAAKKFIEHAARSACAAADATAWESMALMESVSAAWAQQVLSEALCARTSDRALHGSERCRGAVCPADAVGSGGRARIAVGMAR